MENETKESLHAALHDSERRAGERYSRQLRQRVVEYAEKRRGESVTWRQIGDELDMYPQVIRNWGRAVHSTTTPRAKFRAVKVIEQNAAVIVYGPRGLRIELDVEGLAELLTRLG